MIITHQMSVVREICTHVAIMKDGEVKEQGLVEEIFSHPKSQVAKELISKDSGNDVESKKLTQSEIQDGEIVRISNRKPYINLPRTCKHSEGKHQKRRRCSQRRNDPPVHE